MFIAKFARSIAVACVLITTAAPVVADADDDQMAQLQAANAEFNRYTRSAVAALESRDDAQALLARAMLGVFGKDEFGMPDLRQLQALLTAPDADAHVLFRAVSMARQPPQTPLSVDVQSAALQRLRAADPGNLAVLELTLTDAIAAGNAAVDDWLADAASSTHHSLYFNASLTLLIDAHAGIAIDAALADAVRFVHDAPVEIEVDGELAAMAPAYGVVMAIAIPSLSAYLQQCDPHRAPAWSDQRAADCLTVARVMAVHADTVYAQMVGMSIWHWLVEGSPAENDIVALKREFHWLMEASSELRADERLTTMARRQLAALRAGRHELDIMREVLLDHCVAPTPADDWLPANPALLDARR